MNRVLLLLSFAFLAACSNADRYKNEIASLDSVLVAVDSAMVSYKAIPVDTLGNLFKKVKGDMSFLQSNYSGEMPREIGVIFSRYRDIPNNIKNMDEVYPQVGTALETARVQLTGLKDAILQGANKDASGNSINGDYIRKNVNTETKLAVDLVEQVKRMEIGSVKAFEHYELYYPQVSPILDSLRAVNAEMQ